MVLKSYSKINLSLLINKKMKSGLHDIQSHFCLINLYDKIKIKKTNKKKDLISFKGKFSKKISYSNNSVKNILNILRKYKIINSFYSVSIYKKIPVFSGLGGGTSNAAFILKYLTKPKISKQIIEKIQHKIGSDMKLFSYKQGFLKNLKDVIHLKKKHKLIFLLVYPNLECSTRDIYSKVNKYSKKQKFNKNILQNKKKYVNYIVDHKNDLQLIVEKKYPIIKNVLKHISAEKGCQFSRISGSGSVCYGLFSSDKNARFAQRNIKKKYPKFWLSVAKTI